MIDGEDQETIGGGTNETGQALEISFPVPTPIETMVQRMVEATLRLTDGDKQRAAELLGTTKRTLYRMLERGQVHDETYTRRKGRQVQQSV